MRKARVLSTQQRHGKNAKIGRGLSDLLVHGLTKMAARAGIPQNAGQRAVDTHEDLRRQDAARPNEANVFQYFLRAPVARHGITTSKADNEMQKRTKNIRSRRKHQAPPATKQEAAEKRHKRSSANNPKVQNACGF